MAISLSVKIGASIDGLLTSLKKAEKEMNAFSRKVSRAGEELTKGLTLPLVGFGVVAVKNFAEAEKAAASLSAQLRANGKDVNKTMGDYTAFALEMQRLTVNEDDAVIGFLQLAEAMQATNAKKAVQDAIGLNAAYGIEMPQAVKMASAAQQGLFTQLSKAIPSIRVLKDDTEKAALAQKIFADGFSVATAQAKVGLGPLQQLTNEIGNATEAFGKVISEALLPIVTHIKNAVQWLDSLSETQRKWIVGIGLTLAAVGPLLLVIGKIPAVIAAMISGFTAFITTMKTVGLFLMANPWLVLAAAITVAAIALARYFDIKANKEWDEVQARQKKRIDDQKKATDEYVAADTKGRAAIIEGLRKQAEAYIGLWKVAQLAGDTKGMEHYKVLVAEINIQVEEMKKASKTAWDVNAAGIEKGKTALEEYIKYMKKMNDVQKYLEENGPGVSATFAQAGQGSTINNAPGQGFQPGAGTIAPQKVDNAATIPGMGGWETTLGDIADAFDPVMDKLTVVGGMWSRTFSSMTDAVSDTFKTLRDKSTEGFQKVLEIAQSAMSVISSIVMDANSQQTQSMNEKYDKERERIEQSTMNEEQKKAALDKLRLAEEKERKKVLREQAKDNKIVAIVQGVINLALGILTGLAQGGPVMAIIAGALGAIALATIITQPLPALAEGGLASAPTMAMVGDNPNANVDPEVIAPLSKLKGYMRQAQEVVVKGVIKGRDIFLSSEYGQLEVQRVRGY